MRCAASASEGAILASLGFVMIDVPELEGDELRLFACGVLARVLVIARRECIESGRTAEYKWQHEMTGQ
jgi:hypothetical protein